MSEETKKELDWLHAQVETFLNNQGIQLHHYVPSVMIQETMFKTAPTQAQYITRYIISYQCVTDPRKPAYNVSHTNKQECLRSFWAAMLKIKSKGNERKN